MSVGMIEKLAEFCVAHGWNYEITAAIVETSIIMILPAALIALILYIITKEQK